jgi:FkbM family methyltransferase
MNAVQRDQLQALLALASRHAPGAEFLEHDPELVLFGAGGRGRRVLSGLRDIGIVPRCFTDNQPSSWGSEVQGLTVLQPATAAKVFPGAVFIATIWSDRLGHPLSAVRSQLANFGIERVASFTALYDKYPETFFPDFFLDRLATAATECAAIVDATDIWAGTESVDEFLAQVALRLTLDFAHVEHASCDYPPYFPPDLFELSDHETFVDCGAYDGDNYHDFERITGGRFRRYIALEPDAENFRKLEERIASTPREAESHKVRLLHCALSERRGTLRFTADGSTESRVSTQGTQEIPCAPLDELLAEETPTYVKMDIEGAEAAALRGACGTLARHRPILAVAAYHRMTDLWRLPLLMANLVEGYAFFLRPEKKAGWDLICYAVPVERLKRAT